MKTFFTSDTHFGHAKIIELSKRPFASVDEMDATLIRNWNARVTDDDIVYHLGDFSFRNQNEYFYALRGQKHLIVGNHDPKRMKQRAGAWASISTLSHIEVEETRLVLCHFGMRVWAKSHHGAIHLYGHSHGNLPGDSQSLDVGVDCWDYQPVTLDEIKARLTTLPKRSEPDHHQPK